MLVAGPTAAVEVVAEMRFTVRTGNLQSWRIACMHAKSGIAVAANPCFIWPQSVTGCLGRLLILSRHALQSFKPHGNLACQDGLVQYVLLLVWQFSSA
mmetsp:Transcript_43297/g.85767  ORF Transcript_43297/g.85767 Transcript_43297/m.85767 type:complete len:98 (-) Transcript_43297:431-724(-)